MGEVVGMVWPWMFGVGMAVDLGSGAGCHVDKGGGGGEGSLENAVLGQGLESEIGNRKSQDVISSPV